MNDISNEYKEAIEKGVSMLTDTQLSKMLDGISNDRELAIGSIDKGELMDFNIACEYRNVTIMREAAKRLRIGLRQASFNDESFNI